MVKYTAIAFAAFSAIGASASASSGMAHTMADDRRDAIIRDLMSKVDILSSELEEQKAELREQKAEVKAHEAWRTELASSSLKHVKAAGIAPQDKTSVRRNLRLEDESAVETSVVDGIILYKLFAEVEKIKEAVEDVHECLEYDHISNTCTLGDGSSISSVAIRGGTIHLQSTSSGIGLTSGEFLRIR